MHVSLSRELLSELQSESKQEWGFKTCHEQTTMSAAELNDVNAHVSTLILINLDADVA
jgi:hypothetical protein